MTSSIVTAPLPLDTPGPPCIVAVDEAHRVGWTGRLAVDLLATGREAQVPVVLLSQGPSDLDEMGRHLLERLVQDAGWVMIFRQGTLDSSRASRILGMRQVEERTWSNDGRETVRLVDREIVPARVHEVLLGDGCDAIGADMNVWLERGDDTNEATWWLEAPGSDRVCTIAEWHWMGNAPSSFGSHGARRVDYMSSLWRIRKEVLSGVHAQARRSIRDQPDQTA